MIPLILALERGPRLCEFTAHWRIRNATELMVYLGFLLVLFRAFAAATEAA
jgi:hypothetical protein